MQDLSVIRLLFFTMRLQANNLNVLKPSFRTSVHNGTTAAIFAGLGGVEFGTGYTNSQHTTVASCNRLPYGAHDR